MVFEVPFKHFGFSTDFVVKSFVSSGFKWPEVIYFFTVLIFFVVLLVWLLVFDSHFQIYDTKNFASTFLQTHEVSTLESFDSQVRLVSCELPSVDEVLALLQPKT